MKKIITLFSILIAGNTLFAQNVGIGTAAPTEKLHVVGNGRFTTLSGVGTRMVVADANGVLGTQALPAGGLTGVTAGDGLVGGGTTGTVTVDVVAVNGLTTNANDIRLGGTLIQNTLITQGTFNMTYNLNSTGDFILEDNGFHLFGADASTQRIGVRTAAPTNMFHMTNGGVNVGATSMALFENAGAAGVALNGTNTNATSGYNAIEGITNYNGTAYIPAGVFGLAIYQGAALAPTIGVRGATNEWQGTGVRGSRFNSGGANNGWGGEFYDDLGYTGFLGTISDMRTKKNIANLNNATSLIMSLRPVTYQYDLEKYPTMGLSRGLEYGFIAQEVESVIPEITRHKNFDTGACAEMKPGALHSNNTEEFVVMDYTRIIPILTKAVQEQQTLIDSQEKEIEEMRKELKELKALIQSKSN